MLPDLVVLSHLRWDFVWQRPQHVVSRLAQGYRGVWFVEEPVVVDGVDRPVMRTVVDGPVTRCWMELPRGVGAGGGFQQDVDECHVGALEELLGGCQRDVWLYTPMALSIGVALRPGVLAYDVMDDLASFRFAPAEVALRQRQAIRAATIVFTGGRSLHAGVVAHRHDGVHCFPSGVEPEHYAPAIIQRRRREGGRRVAGYVGVIDERLDLGLLGGLAEALPEWQIRVVGPVAKIDPAELPRAANIVYTGPVGYGELPAAMAEFDVALMPFALNESTRAISPTKTLEYLAAGLPVVSTRVPDVVADFERVVDLRDDAAGFALACRHALAAHGPKWHERVSPVLRAAHWDHIAGSMGALIEAGRGESGAAIGESA
jgi:glycosyltransferase involved in cell wall biosynthesis